MSSHTTIHDGVRRLRGLLGLRNSECSRCKSDRERERVESKTRAVDYGYIDKSVIAEQLARRPIKTSYGVNREFFSYNRLAADERLINMGYVTKLFNAYCAENGVQCTVTSDPKDFAQLFHFKNVGDRQVKIMHLDQVRILQPGESITMKALDTRYALAEQSRLPQIESMGPPPSTTQPLESAGWIDYKGSSL